MKGRADLTICGTLLCVAWLLLFLLFFYKPICCANVLASVPGSWFGVSSPGNVEGLTVLTPKIICTGLQEGAEGCDRHLVVTLSTSPFLQ